ncbi:MAG: hypothetical protein AB9873_11945 [Syntrophobacteraceae bacterium]
MRKVGAIAACGLFLVGVAGCSYVKYIPWIGKPKSCDLNKYRVPAVSSRSDVELAEIRGSGPALEVPETEFDFGKVSEDKLLIHDFKVRNVGKSVLKIKKVVPS